MKIVVDAHIPFIVEAVQREWPDVTIVPMEPEKIDALTLQDTDVLIVRTRTKVNASLLANSSVRLVCTATIGFDHIDTAYCEANSIQWISCPGCNAQAVCDYIEEALREYIQATSPALPLTIGVVGVGHVGSLVAQMAAKNGHNVLLNDPPRRIGVSLDEISANCDVITFHVPLTRGTQYPTFHLCDATFLDACKQDALIINAARGGVVDEEALLHSTHPYILDTWEGEPDLNPRVLNGAFRGSMHIAGYSVEGKRKASQMCLDAVSDAFGLPRIDLTNYRFTGLSATQRNDEAWLAAISETLKAHPCDFEALRKAYPLREG